MFSDCGETISDSQNEKGLTDGITLAPWMVSIGILNGETFTHQCGGSLITPIHVLTAAHCFRGLRKDHLPEG